jgi:hypothetical protein
VGGASRHGRRRARRGAAAPRRWPGHCGGRERDAQATLQKFFIHALLPRGVTTVLSQGDAGADNLEAFFHDTIESSRTLVRLAINLSRVGESAPGGCFARLQNADVAACVAAIQRRREAIWGIAVNASHHACRHTDPRLVVRRGLEAAARTGLPLLYGMQRTSDWPFADQLRQLRSGNVVTYCFRRQPHCIIREDRVDPAIRSRPEHLPTSRSCGPVARRSRSATPMARSEPGFLVPHGLKTQRAEEIAT